MSSACLVQFFHPGPEYDRSETHADWTSGRQLHRRKFMQATGGAVGSTGDIRGDLVFWGEWEPQADRVRALTTDGVGLPRRLWRPYWSLTGAPPNRLNTDPMVFGGFRYTVCQQHRSNRGGSYKTGLQRLAPGSVILFGSNLDGDFVLDTVFVIRDSTRHDPTNYRKLFVPREYFEVTIATLYQGVSDDGCCKAPDAGDQYNLYEGATVDAPVEGMYSYVPCQALADTADRGFPRPRIRHPFISSTKNQSYSFPIKGDREAIRSMWQEVRNQVLSQGLRLATWLDFPPERG